METSVAYLVKLVRDVLINSVKQAFVMARAARDAMNAINDGSANEAQTDLQKFMVLLSSMPSVSCFGRANVRSKVCWNYQ